MRTALCGLLALMMWAGVAQAQTQAAPDAEKDKMAIVNGARASSPTDAGVARTGFEAILHASADDTNVSARIGAQVAEKWVIDAVMTAPLEKGMARSSALALSGNPLRDDAKFSIGFSRTANWDFKTDEAEIRRVCAEVAGVSGGCNTVNPLIPAHLSRRLRNAYTLNTAWTYGGRISVTRTAFEYRPTAADTTVKDSHLTPIAASGGVAALFANNWILEVHGGVEHVWQQADPKHLCSPVDDSVAVLECEEVTVGTSHETTGGLFSVEMRRFFSKVAIAPRFEYRATKKLKLLEVPFYFLSDPDSGGWTGGVMYRLKNGESSVAVFAGSKLPHFGLK